MIRDSFRDYCQEKLMPRVVMANRHERKSLTRNQLMYHKQWKSVLLYHVKSIFILLVKG